MPQVYLLFATDAWEWTFLWCRCHKEFLRMSTHQQHVRMLHAMRTPQAIRKRIPLFQPDAWKRSKEAIAIRVSKQGKRFTS
jgi:hypothetical protein